MDDQDYSHERELGRRIAALREAAGLTQRELARRLQLTQSALSRIESGQRRLSAAQASQVARTLGIDPGELLAAGPADSSFESSESAMLPAAMPLSASSAEPPAPSASFARPLRLEARDATRCKPRGHQALHDVA